MPLQDIHPVEAMLKRRGFEVIRKDPREYLFFPVGLGEGFEDELYSHLKRYSFRIVIRDVIKNRKSFRVDDLLKYSTREAIEEDLSFLLSSGVIKEIGEGLYCLKADAVFSFGDTLEWFIAQVFEREFASPALWGVRLAGVSAGGDYDVISSVEGRLVCVEVKSSPPRNVEEGDISSFLRRVEALRPSLAIFIEDTRLRMKDKIVPFFETALKDRGLQVTRVVEEIFTAGGRLFITNSKPDIVANIGLCVRRYLSPDPFL